MYKISLKFIKQLYVSFTNWLVSHIPPDEMNDICLIRLDELGDFVIWLDSAKEFRNLYPNRKITLIVNEKWKDLAETLSYWDEVISIDTTKFRFNIFYRIKYLAFIRHQGFNTVICPRYSVQYLLEPGLIAISGAEHKIIYAGSFPLEKKNYYTQVTSFPKQTHELNRNADFMRELGLKDFKSTVPKLNFKTTQGDYIVVSPTSLRKRKEWSTPKFNILICKIELETGLKVIICSDKKIDTMPFGENYSGKTTVMQFIQIIANAKLVIANDSAAIHIASACDVPSVCIGSERYARFVPYEIEIPREGMILPKLVYREHIEDITVEEVFKAVKEIL